MVDFAVNTSLKRVSFDNQRYGIVIVISFSTWLVTPQVKGSLKVRFFESQSGEILFRNQFRPLVKVPVAGLLGVIGIARHPEWVAAPFNGKDLVDGTMDTVIGHIFPAPITPMVFISSMFISVFPLI